MGWPAMAPMAAAKPHPGAKASSPGCRTGGLCVCGDATQRVVPMKLTELTRVLADVRIADCATHQAVRAHEEQGPAMFYVPSARPLRSAAPDARPQTVRGHEEQGPAMFTRQAQARSGARRRMLDRQAVRAHEALDVPGPRGEPRKQLHLPW